MAVAGRIGLIGQEIREWISPSALEILIGQAERISEGAFDGPPGPNQCYLATIQLRVSLSSCDHYLSGPLDAVSARRAAELIRQDPLAREILNEVALKEAERGAGCALHQAQVDMDASHRGDTLVFSMDVEARVQPGWCQGGMGP